MWLCEAKLDTDISESSSNGFRRLEESIKDGQVR